MRTYIHNHQSHYKPSKKKGTEEVRNQVVRREVRVEDVERDEQNAKRISGGSDAVSKTVIQKSRVWFDSSTQECEIDLYLCVLISHKHLKLLRKFSERTDG